MSSTRPEPALDPDVAQEWRHWVRKHAEQLRIMREAYEAEGFTSETAEIMCIEFWRISNMAASQPDFSKIFDKFMPSEDEDFEQ